MRAATWHTLQTAYPDSVYTKTSKLCLHQLLALLFSLKMNVVATRTSLLQRTGPMRLHLLPMKGDQVLSHLEETREIVLRHLAVNPAQPKQSPRQQP